MTGMTRNSAGPLTAVIALIALATAPGAQSTPPVSERQGMASYTPSPENLKSREWFQDAKFGLFIHWGVYSVLGDGEWVMNNQRIRVADYEKLPAFFNPVEFNAAEWVALAKSAGMNYMTITSKHHDGFAMFDSKITDWDIVERTPWKKDPLKLLAEETRKQGMKLFFYHSQLDWHHPDYFPRGRTGRDAGRDDKGDWYKYLDFMDAQLTELLTSYGPIGGIWFDGMWDKPDADWRLGETYELIHKLQPATLVGSNHHKLPYTGEDFQMFEKDLPGANTAGFNTTEIGSLPIETCETINGAWGFNLQDSRHKSTKELVQYLVRAAGYGGNFLLNVGPMPNGRIQPEHVERLRAIGQWLKAHGDSIYGTRRGPVPPRPWGVTTRKGNTVFVHILEWEDQAIALPDLGGKVKAARFLKSGAPAAYEQAAGSLVVTIPPAARDEFDTVVAFELQ
jgi:alpha-L-fucosidase